MMLQKEDYPVVTRRELIPESEVCKYRDFRVILKTSRDSHPCLRQTHDIEPCIVIGTIPEVDFPESLYCCNISPYLAPYSLLTLGTWPRSAVPEIGWAREWTAQVVAFQSPGW